MVWNAFHVPNVRIDRQTRTHAGVILAETQKHAKLLCLHRRRAGKGPSRFVARAASTRPGPRYSYAYIALLRPQ